MLNLLEESTTFRLGDLYDDYEVMAPCTMNTSHQVELAVGAYLHSIICILGLVGNALVIATFAGYKRTRSVTDVFLLNVAVSDLLFVAALPLIIYSEHWAWPLGGASCKLLRAAYSVNLYSGMLLLACVSADRYASVVHARRSLGRRSLLSCRLLCGLVWVLAVTLSLPTVLFYQRYRPAHSMPQDETERFPSNDSSEAGYVCDFQFPDENLAQTMKVVVPGLQMAVGFFLPLLIMLFCYAGVLRTLLGARSFQRHRAIRLVLLVVALFVACHLPYNATLLYETLHKFTLSSCGEADALQATKSATKGVAYLHCCLNPALYAFAGASFRSHFKKMVGDLFYMGGRLGSSRHRSRDTSNMYVSSRRSGASNASSFTM